MLDTKETIASPTQAMHASALASLSKLTPDPAGMVRVPSGRQTRTVTSPLTGLDLPPLPQATAQDVVTAAQTGREAARRWAQTPIAARQKLLLRMHDMMWKHRDELLDIIQLESGKSRIHAFDEIQDFAITTRYYARMSASILKPKRRRGAIPVLTRVDEHYQPKGLVGIISPWNYPLSLAASDAVAAITAGNAVILKPDSQTPHTAIAIVSLLIKAGLDPDLLQILPGAGSEIGTPMIEAVDYMMFTGSSATGANVAAQCSQRLIGCSAELGGKNPMIVMPDANLKAAVDGAVRACFASGGQLCISIERLYVHESIFTEFLSQFASAIETLKIGPSLEWEHDVGVLISKKHAQTVDDYVQDAIAKGAKVWAGGKRRTDLGETAYSPTLLTGVTPQMRLYREETFGPVVAAYPFATAQEAIEMANDTEYGLNASVWSTPAKGRAIAAQIQAGTVNVNEGFAPAWGSIDAPMGGMGVSGLGRRHGSDGLLKYTEPQTIATQYLLPLGSPRTQWNEQFASLMTIALQAMRYLGLR